MIYIIADDLTGATDSGVKLSKKGYSTVVSIAEEGTDLREGNRNVDVHVIDSETRELSAEEAYEKLSGFINRVDIGKEDIIYKKVDSTLRGNIGAEIKALMENLNLSLCLFTPSFPENDREVVGGYLLVEETPLGNSEYYDGDLEPGEASYIPSLLENQCDVAIGKIELKDVMKNSQELFETVNDLYQSGKKLIIFDSLNDKHLHNILDCSLNFSEPILYSGSAGLANNLPHIFQANQRERFIEQSPFFIVIGTRQKVMDAQIEYLQKKMDLFCLEVDITKLYKDKDKYLKYYLQEALENITNGEHLVLRPTLSTEIPGFDSRKLEVIVRDMLGAMASKVINNTNFKNLFLTGGDTARGVCKALGIHSLNIINELLPGIPLSEPRKEDYNYLNIITKAGGFGKKSTLYKIIDKMNREENINKFKKTRQKNRDL